MAISVATTTAIPQIIRRVKPRQVLTCSRYSASWLSLISTPVGNAAMSTLAAAHYSLGRVRG